MIDLLSNVPVKNMIQSNTTHNQQLADEEVNPQENTHILHRLERAALHRQDQVLHGLLPLLHPYRAALPLEGLV